MEIILSGSLSTLFLVLAMLAGFFSYKLVVLDAKTARKARGRYESLSSAVTGGAILKTDRLPDGIVRAGMVFNPRKNRIEPNGKLSNDFVDHVAGF